MRSRSIISLVLLTAAVAYSYGVQGAPPPERSSPSPVSIAQQQRERSSAGLARLEHEHLQWPGDRALFQDAARSAWSFVNQHYQPSTGFVMPLGKYRFTTMWDVGGMLAALYSARQLGFIDHATYENRTERLLDTLMRLPLYDSRAFNRWYDARTGARVDRGYERPDQFSGWSATDLGRLLVWLKVIGLAPRFQEKAAAVVARIDMTKVVRSGYLWGEDLDDQGRQRVFQEGRIGYEQYAARGFALWGYPAEKALNLDENALPVTVLGRPLVADVRRFDRLTNEPFVLWGLELGWDARTASLARQMLLAQEARYHKTGVITITGEDSVQRPPHFFYYYCVYSDGKHFAVDVPNDSAVVDGPRWISAKSAFGFHALMPNRYTDAAVRAVNPAREPAGWASGVYEGSATPTGSISINTAAVILTAAVVNMTGAPILEQARRSAGEQVP